MDNIETIPKLRVPYRSEHICHSFFESLDEFDISKTAAPNNSNPRRSKKHGGASKL